MTKVCLHCLQPLPKKINNLITQKKTISTTSNIVFALLLTFFSFDFGFVRFKSSTSGILKTFCAIKILIISFFVAYIFIYELDDIHHMVWLCIGTVKHVVVVFALIFSKSTLLDFYNNLLFIDHKLSCTNSYSLEYFVIILTSYSIIIRIVIHLTYCFGPVCQNYCSPVISLVIINNITVVANELFLFVCFIIYYFLYCRLKVFTSIVCNDSSNIVASNKLIYKSIADLSDRIKPVYNNLYAIFLSFNIIIIMSTTFRPLLSTDLQHWSLNIATIMTVLQIFITQFSPALAAGLLASQVDQLRIVLHNKLIEEKDPLLTKNIEKFIHYVEARPLKVAIWKVIPLDWQLPVITVNIIVTYLIVVLQFSHKY